MEARVRHEEEIPLGQRLFDSWFLLLVVGVVVVGVLYVGWGLYEIVSMPEATLP
jgi:cytochrome c-type biogenesis protein CcmH/NrfG